MSVHSLLGEFKEEKMDRMEFTIYFENPFWTGICIRYTDSCIFSARYVFGSEPSNGEILDFYLKQFDSLRFVKSSFQGKDSLVKNVSFKKSLHKGSKEQKQTGRKALEIFNQGLSDSLNAKKRNLKKEDIQECKEKYSRNQIKKKQKKRGH